MTVLPSGFCKSSVWHGNARPLTQWIRPSYAIFKPNTGFALKQSGMGWYSFFLVLLMNKLINIYIKKEVKGGAANHEAS